MMQNNEIIMPQAQVVKDEISNFNLLRPAFVLAKYWKMIVCVPIVVSVATVTFTLFMPNIYTAKAMILPGEDNNVGMLNAMMAQVGGLAALAGDFGGATKADLYVTLLKSEPIKDQIIEKFKLLQVYDVKYRVKAYAILDDNVAVSTGKKDGVITIATSAKDPVLAAALANAYVDELGKMTAKISMDGAGKTRVFLQERLAKAKADLAVAEENMKSFQASKKVFDVPDQARATLESVVQLRAQLTAQNVQLAALRQQLREESHEIKSAKATIAGLLREIAKVEGSQTGDAIPGVGAMPKLGQEYVRLMRNFKIQETLVELLTKQYEMTKLNEAKDVVPFHLLQSAKLPELKSRPKRAIIVLMASFLSCFITVLLAFTREYFANLNEAERKQWSELLKKLSIRKHAVKAD